MVIAIADLPDHHSHLRRTLMSPAVRRSCSAVHCHRLASLRPGEPRRSPSENSALALRREEVEYLLAEIRIAASPET